MPTKTEEIANKDPMLNLNKPFEEAFKPLPTYQAWKKIGFTPRFGVLIPLASIRSRHNFGVGEFGDITIFKEFCKSIGSTIIQLLPLNDMGRSKVPYSSISAFALDPVYISLKDIDEFKYPSDDLKHYLEENWHIIEEEKNSKYINYEKIRIFKFGALFKLFWDFVNRNSYNGSHRWHQFQSFIRNNEYWLEDYAVFRTLKNFYSWTSWKEWPEEYKSRNKESLERFKHDNRDELLFVKFTQWVAYQQLSQAHNECLEEGIFIKGDIPLQVDFDSADVWAHQDYFNLDVCAGAPPDQYSQMGQNWGSPTYNWGNLCRDNYLFWRKRLEYASHFYDIFRIDHIVGIFRIWTIPITPEFPRGTPAGDNGYFQPEDPGKAPYKPVWEIHGKMILKMMLESCDMLPIGEDLGTIPAVCRKTMKNLGIPGYKVLIWEREWSEEGSPFIDPNEYEYISMSTTTTHDFWSLPGYFHYQAPSPHMQEAHNNDIKALWEFVMGKGEKFAGNYTQEFHKKLLTTLFDSNSVLLILPFNDLWGIIPGLFGEDFNYDRINDPGDPHREANWSVKLPFNLEDYREIPKLHSTLNLLKDLAKSSGRFLEEAEN